MSDTERKVGTNFPSTYAIGERCLFQPNLNKINARNGKTTDPYSAVECRIAEAHFTAGKVRYSIEVRYQELEQEFWMPIGRVDSIMVCPIDPDDGEE
jgi:hypothetical protein